MDDNQADRLNKALDAKYASADLDKLVSESGLEPEQKNGLLRLLQRFEELFSSTLGTFNMEPYNIELAEGAKPYHLKRPYTILQAYLKTVKLEVERLLKLEILERINDSEWAAGAFIITKNTRLYAFKQTSEN